jgi:hypothetical protein
MRWKLAVLVASIAVGTGTCLIGVSPASGYSGPIFQVMNTSETPPDGIYFRNSPHTWDYSAIYGYGVFMNEYVQLNCYAWGDSVGQYNNTLWYYANNVTRPIVAATGQQNVGYLNAHYVNDGLLANQVDGGVPPCSNSTPPPPPPPIYSATSANWAGYAATASDVTYVHGAWRIPKLVCGTTSTQSSQWAGIDGYRSTTNTLVQAGSEADCSKGKPAYHIWSEQVPDTQRTVIGNAGKVTAGDSVVVDVRYHAGTQNWSISLVVNGTVRLGLSGTDAIAPRASAECIAEAPKDRYGNIQPLANYGTVTFTSCSMALSGATTAQQLGSGSQNGLTVYRIDMSSIAGEATTGGPSADGSTWIVTWKAG